MSGFVVPLVFMLTLLQLRGAVYALCENCSPLQFNCGSFWSSMNPLPDVRQMCSPSTLIVVGKRPDIWNDMNSVKSYRPLNQMEWYAVTPNENEQAGVGLSTTYEADGGIRFNQNSVGFYLNIKKAFWGTPETPTPDGWNTNFANRLKKDPNNRSNAMQIAVDYKANTVYYKHPKCYAIKFVLPKPFHGKPLYAHVQVWNSNTVTLTQLTQCSAYYKFCIANYFNIASFYGLNNKPSQISQHVTKTTMRVSGGEFFEYNAVKTARVLNEDEWIGVLSTRGEQYGIGVSLVGGSEGGIRYRRTNVGCYLVAKHCYWAYPETPTPGGLNKSFQNRLVRDPKGIAGMWVKVDYSTNTLWLRYPYMKPISFGLPDSFKGKPVFGLYQVWNSCSLRYAYPMPSSAASFQLQSSTLAY